MPPTDVRTDRVISAYLPYRGGILPESRTRKCVKKSDVSGIWISSDVANAALFVTFEIASTTSEITQKTTSV